MKLSGTMYELWDHQNPNGKRRKKWSLYRHDHFLPAGTAVDVGVKFPKGTRLTTPMTEPDGFGYAAPPPTSKTMSSCAYIEKPEVAFGGMVWHIGGGNAYNITPWMAEDDGWYLVDPDEYPHG